MHRTTTSNRASAIDALFGQICRATPQEARALALLLAPPARAEMALFCYSRAHLREQGRSIAAACTPESLVKIGGPAGEALLCRIEGEGDTWGALARLERRHISLAGR